MNNDLLIKTLRRLQERFNAASEKWPTIRLAASNGAYPLQGNRMVDGGLIDWTAADGTLWVTWLYDSDPMAPFHAEIEETIEEADYIRAAAHAFVGLASEAGHAARSVLPPGYVGRWSPPAPVWIETVFRTAWKWPDGSLLRAMRERGAVVREALKAYAQETGTPEEAALDNAWYSLLQPDPFAASAGMIDILLDDPLGNRSTADNETAGEAPQADRTDSKTDKSGKSVPENPEVLRLAKAIKRRAAGETKKDAALVFAEGNALKADSLLRQLRRYPDLMK